MKLSTTKTSDITITTNLLNWYNKSTASQRSSGLNWYKESQDFAKILSTKHNIDTYTAATVISCLSPNNKWERNKIDAETVIIAFKNNIHPDHIKVCTYNANKLKAFRALKGELISQKAPKTHAFAMNVGLLSADHITIDKWHLRACIVSPKDGILDCSESCTIIQYRRVEALTSKLAKTLDLKGYELQAIIWVTIKNSWGR